MKVTSIKTHKITSQDRDLLAILDTYITELEENSIVAITSKIVAIAEGRVVSVSDVTKDELIKKEADFYLPREENKYNLFLTIKNNLLAVSAGIDESNADGNFVLWPQDPQKSANLVRHHLTEKFNIKNVGVIITDSKTTPLRWGVTGAAIGFSGFAPLNDLIGSNDIFGRQLKMTKVGILDGLAAAAVLAMGEGAEQTPLAVISDVPFVKFVDHDPSEAELAELAISMDDDVYAPLLKSVNWQKKK